GKCSGSNGVSWCNVSTTFRLIRAGFQYFGPPCTTRWPTAANFSKCDWPESQSINTFTADTWFGAEIFREKLSAADEPFTLNADPADAIPSILPSKTLRKPPVSNKANLMLEEPPLTLKTYCVAGFTESSLFQVARFEPLPFSPSLHS